MAQTVNEVTDLMSGKTRRPNSGFQVPTPVKYFYGTGVGFIDTNFDHGWQSIA